MLIHSKELLMKNRRNFPAEQIIVNNSTGGNTGTFTLKSKQNFWVEMYGGGAGGSSSQRNSNWFYGPGSSGAGFAGVVTLTPGVYTWLVGTAGYGWNINNAWDQSGSVGGGDSYLKKGDINVITAGGAPANHNSYSESSGVGILSYNTTDFNFGAIEKAVNGNPATATNNPGVSVYDGTLTGYGAGNNSYIYSGTRYAVAGLVFIRAL